MQRTKKKPGKNRQIPLTKKNIFHILRRQQMAALEPLPTCTHVQCSHTKVRTHAPESVRSTVCRDAATTLFNLQSSASPRFFVAFHFSFL